MYGKVLRGLNISGNYGSAMGMYSVAAKYYFPTEPQLSINIHKISLTMKQK